MLAAEDLRFSYHAGREVLGGVSCRVESGVVTGVLGPNGSGKTTLLRLLLGLRRPGGGCVTLDGVDVRRIDRRMRASRLAYVPQRPSATFAFSVRQVVSMGRHALGDRTGSMVEEALERVGLLESAEAPFAELSVGQQQLAAVARALAQLSPGAKGKFLLADEPMSALDPKHAIEAQGVLRELAASGVGVGVVMHDITAGARLSDRVIVLHGEGRVAAEGPTPTTCTPEVLAGVYGVAFDRVGENLLPAGVISDRI